LGEKWFVLEFKWWSSWKEFVRFDEDDLQQSEEKDKKLKRDNTGGSHTSQETSSEGPNQIDNNGLIAESPTAAAGANEPTTANLTGPVKLKQGLQEDEDFVLVSNSVWQLLHQW
jgi:hypothetical protein